MGNSCGGGGEKTVHPNSSATPEKDAYKKRKQFNTLPENDKFEKSELDNFVLKVIPKDDEAKGLLTTTLKSHLLPVVRHDGLLRAHALRGRHAVDASDFVKPRPVELRRVRRGRRHPHVRRRAIDLRRLLRDGEDARVRLEYGPLGMGWALPGNKGKECTK